MKVLDKGYIELMQHMGDDNTVVASARVSYLGTSKGEETDRKLIHYLMKNQHMSPFESVIFQFRIKCPLFIRSQWMRHRTWSYNEVSRRYTSEEIDFFIPKILRTQDTKNKQGSADEFLDNPAVHIQGFIGDASDAIEVATNRSYDAYLSLLEAGVARELARMVLPQNMYTTFYGTVNLRNLLHFLDLRLDAHAQPEIRVYAEAINSLITPIVPVTCEAWKLYGVK